MTPWPLAAVLITLAAPLGAWGWLSEPPPAAPADETFDALPQGGAESLCLAAILQAEVRYGIPDHLLLALGLQEAGYRGSQGLTIWPWSVNAAGEGRRFDSPQAAQAFVLRKQAAGVESIDVGCLQINLRWHPEAFGTLTQGFDPVHNVDYAARFLRALYDESGDWWQAAGEYHSKSPGPQATYLASLRRNHQVAKARIDQFAALAQGADLRLPEDDLQIAQSPKGRTPTPYRTEGAIWGADLSGSEGERRSLYSALDLEPILPTFLPPET